MDISKIAKTTLAGIGALFRNGNPNSPHSDGLDPVPDGVKDALMYRLMRGEFQPDRPAPLPRWRLEKLDGDYFTDTRYRDG